jgi:hypothetical protein
MPTATPPRKWGNVGRVARTLFVELENTLAACGWPTSGGLVIEAEGLLLILADRASVAILADLFLVVRPDGKGGSP